MTTRSGPDAPRHTRQLTRVQRFAIYVTAGAAWFSGALWLVFHHFLRRQGEFALEPHPLENWWLRLHGLCAFVLLWLAGLLWALHARHAVRWPQRRGSGLALMVAFGVLASSGYLLYYANDGALRDGMELAHWITGLAVVVPVVLHALPPRRSRAARVRTGGVTDV